jgi:hypothetical protein
LWDFVNHLQVHPVPKQEIAPILELSGIMCAVIALMSFIVLWMADLSRSSTTQKPSLQ